MSERSQLQDQLRSAKLSQSLAQVRAHPASFIVLWHACEGCTHELEDHLPMCKSCCADLPVSRGTERLSPACAPNPPMQWMHGSIKWPMLRCVGLHAGAG